jgi:hypothetical protein
MTSMLAIRSAADYLVYQVVLWGGEYSVRNIAKAAKRLESEKPCKKRVFIAECVSYGMVATTPALWVK